jgi:uncharacterized repeat protein (TIGR03803 family)
MNLAEFGKIGAFTAARMVSPGQRNPVTWGTRFKHLAAIVCIVACSLFPGGRCFGQVLEVVTQTANFDGAVPDSSLLRGNDGNFYGTTEYGGTANLGTVFQLTSAGVLTTLASFTGTNGQYPTVGLIEGNDGDFYGTTSSGGTGQTASGTVFKITPTGTLATLVTFTGTNGSSPLSPLAQASDGNFYGATVFGGASGAGAVYKVTPAGAFSLLVSFTGTNGSSPYAGLISGSNGLLYGSTFAGGTGSDGTLFTVSTSGSLNTLVNLNGSTGQNPQCSLVLGSDGNFYGTTSHTLFKLSSSGSFSSLAGIGGTLQGLIQAEDGNLYGVGNAGGALAVGFVFKATTSGSVSTILSFNGTDGSYPKGSLAQGTDGYLYGTTSQGGSANGGTVFKINPAGAFGTVFNFAGGSGENSSLSSASPGLVEGADGAFYGTTKGDFPEGYGTVFRVTPTGTVTTIANFNETNGWRPDGLTTGTDGNFYGTTEAGGASDNGAVFKVTPSGVLTLLASFSGTNGSLPFGGLVSGTDGNFYGTTYEGGAGNTGTVFKVTPAGVLTSLVSVSAANDSYPTAGLILGGDGNFYGTTFGGAGAVFMMTPSGTLTNISNLNGSTGLGLYGNLLEGTDGSFYSTANYAGPSGSAGFGTVFNVNTSGNATTLAAFTGTNGATPYAGVVWGPDGDLYGTTYAGGSENGGTVFQLTTSGTLTMVADLSGNPATVNPQAPFLLASDGNLYGTTAASIIRLIFPGAPIVGTEPAQSVTVGSASLVGKVNARGSPTSIVFQYGTDGVNFPNSVTAYPESISGYLSTVVGATLTGLPATGSYYYRVQATNSFGASTSAAQEVSALNLPTVAATAVTNISSSEATLNGQANANGAASSMIIQYGTDGVTFPYEVTPSPAVVIGSTNTTITATVASLSQGSTYYYRLVGTNTVGTAASGPVGFSTLEPPTATVGGAVPLSTISAEVSGTVNAQGSSTQAAFETGTDGVNFLNSIAANPTTVTGATDTAVSAILTNLSQGQTYYYRIRGASAGGVCTSDTGSFTLDFLSGLTQTYPAAPANADGFLLVNLAPSGLAGEGWRFIGEQQWRQPGIPLGGLASGNFNIEFRPVPGYLQPPSEPVQITSGSAATVVSAEYYQTPVATNDGINVALLPTSVTTGTEPAQWEFVGDNGTHWRNSGTTASNLSAGVYLVEFKPVPGQTTPATEAIGVPGPNGAPIVSATAAYFLSGTPVGAVPAPLPYSIIVSGTGLPYAFVGQIRSDDGEATGFVVMDRVVATAGHVVFDDATLSYTTGLQWLFQREAGTYEPEPLTPAGSYVLSGYAAQRILENTPGVSSPQSQDLDAAAMYFTQEAAPSASGTGAFGGYLASDSEANEFLLSPALMTLAGYPIDGIPAANQGQMFATPPANIGFSLEEPAEIDGTTGVPYRLYTTTGITAAGGMSGGPLCVQFQGGAYYPAAIYLGGNGETVVRAIDSNVVNLFNAAEASGNTGANHGSGGIIQVDAPGSAATFTTGGMNVTLDPAGAVAAGAGWSVDTGGSYQASGATLSNLTPGTYVVTYAPVAGYQTPAAQNVPVESGEIATFPASYIKIPPPTITSGSEATAIEGQPFNYQIKTSPDATGYSASALPAGIAMDSSTGLISGTALEVANAAGIFPISLQATDSTGPGAPFILSLRVAAPGTLNVSIGGEGTLSKVHPNPQAVGGSVSIKATPAHGYLFGYWSDTDTDDVLTYQQDYTFTMPSLYDIEANFVVNPFLTANGSYLALLQGETYAESGFAKITVAANGSFKAIYNLGGIAVNTHGVFGSLGQYQGSFTVPGGSSYSATLSLTAGALLTGTLTNQTDSSQIPLEAEKAVPRLDAALAGPYTALLPAVSGNGLPGGNGYGSLTVSKTGAVKFAGKLGDGLPVTFSGSLDSNGVLPFLFAKPAGRTTGAELLLGSVAFPPAASGTAGTLTWYRTKDSLYPNGFSTTIPFLTGRYTAPPVSYGSAHVTFSAGDLTTSVVEPISINLGLRDQVTTTGPTPFTLKFTAATGLFTGTFPDSGAPRPFTGAVLQSGSTGLGLFQEPSGATGSVLLRTTP